MTSLIEQAAQRLAQLREAGIEVPDTQARDAPDSYFAEGPAMGAGALRSATTSAETRFNNGGTRRYEKEARKHASPSEPVDPSALSRRVELDLTAIATTGIVTPDAPRSHLADQYRVIKRPLIANALGRGAAIVKHGNLIMVTSALPGEGKSFTSINLAMSIAAELDHTVMLVDADVARPSVLRMLGLKPGPGLLDLLEGKAEMSDVLLRTNVDKLTVLPSGQSHPRATELLASDAMSELLDDMATRYPDRIIIFDSPPLLLTTESRVLATHMGQIVVVVQADRTLQSTVKQALATIDSCPLKLMVLNKSRTGAGGTYGESYGYGYGYGEAYGYGYGYGYGRGPGGKSRDNPGENVGAAPAQIPTTVAPGSAKQTV